MRINLQNILLLTFVFALRVQIGIACDLLIGEISHVSVKQWFNFLHEVCSKFLLMNPIKLGGPGKIVQIDETALDTNVNLNRGYIRGTGLK